MTNSERHQKILAEMHETYKTKNAAYGDSFAKSIAKYGYIAALVRLNDKFERLESLISKNGVENDERLRDTCLDAANYFTMLAIEMDKKEKAAANKPRPD